MDLTISAGIACALSLDSKVFHKMIKNKKNTKDKKKKTNKLINLREIIEKKFGR